MAGRADLDLYNVLLGFGWARERVELVKATLDPSFLVRARRALFPLPGVDRRAPVKSSRGWSAAPARHGVSAIPSGRQFTLDLVVHDAA